MTSYEDTAARLLSFKTREFGRGASEEAIARAEKTLGVSIRGGYRRFLRQFGWGGVEHLELYGLGRDVPPHLNLVRVTLSERNEAEPRLPHHLVPVMNDGSGNLHCLDTRNQNEPSIVFWDHEAMEDQKPEFEATDFSSWLAEQLGAW